MALKGCLAQVKQQSSAVVMTTEATTSTDDLTYLIDDADKRIIDINTPVIVYDGGVATTGYTINYLSGSVTFKEATTRVITITGAYVLLTTVAQANSFSYSGSRGTVDITKFNATFKEYLPLPLTATADLGLFYDVTSDFFTMLTDGTIKVVEYYPNVSLEPVRFFALCTSNGINSPVGGVIDESVTFQVTTEIKS